MIVVEILVLVLDGHNEDWPPTDRRCEVYADGPTIDVLWIAGVDEAVGAWCAKRNEMGKNEWMLCINHEICTVDCCRRCLLTMGGVQ